MERHQLGHDSEAPVSRNVAGVGRAGRQSGPNGSMGRHKPVVRHEQRSSAGPHDSAAARGGAWLHLAIEYHHRKEGEDDRRDEDADDRRQADDVGEVRQHLV